MRKMAKFTQLGLLLLAVSSVSVGDKLGRVEDLQKKAVEKDILRGKDPAALPLNQDEKYPKQESLMGKKAIPQEELPPDNSLSRGDRIEPKKGGRVGEGKPVERGQLASSPECRKEIDFYCPTVLLSSDILVLECLVNKVAQSADLSSACDNLLHQYKLDMTKDERFTSAAEKFCSNETIFTDLCGKHKGKSNDRLLKCLIENKSEMPEGSQCRTFMTRVETVVFSDWDLVKPFLEACDTDIGQFNCGSVKGAPTVQHRINHSQGATVDCLIKVLVDRTSDPPHKLQPSCRQQLLRIAELQSDDFHLNRPLYLACRGDRDKFCPTVVAGEGRVLACLMKNVQDAKMSPECSIQLSVEQRLMGEDYKVSHGLVKSCAAPIKQYGCGAPDGANQDQFYLSYVILCLEGAVRFGGNKSLPNDCAAQIMDHRKALMSDYRMSPEVVTSCRFEIQKICANLDVGGQTIHCLMGAIANRRINVRECITAVERLVKAADVGSSYKADPLLQQSCGSAITEFCASRQTSEAEVLSCLMDQLETKGLKKECEKRLMEVQYFLSRDFTMDPLLYRACRREAVEICNAKNVWTPEQAKMLPPGATQSPADSIELVLPCLYRNAYDESNFVTVGPPAVEPNRINPDDPNNIPVMPPPQLSPKPQFSRQCAQEVRRVMRERAISARLLPQINEACLDELASRCSEKTEPGEEFICLQDNLDKLNENCKKAVEQFTQAESQDVKLNRALSRACKPVIKAHCKYFANEDIDHGDVVECLQKHKGEVEMNSKCRAYVTHYELVSMKDYQFAYKFKRACKEDVQQHCGPNIPSGDKSAVIRCLSKILLNQELLGVKEGIPSLDAECKKQLKVEYLSIRETDETMKPELKKNCGNDIKSLCGNPDFSVGDVMECLRDKKDELQKVCRKYIFYHEEMQFADNKLDVMLQRRCHKEILTFCAATDPSKVLACLKQHHRETEMSHGCREVVQRRMQEQAGDVLLQPRVRKFCAGDIQQYCAAAMEKLMAKVKQQDDENVDDSGHKDTTENPLANEVMTCLRRQFVVKDHTTLSQACKAEMRQLIIDSELDERLDKPFYRGCKREIHRLCANAVMETERGGQTHRRVLECMKSHHYSGRVADEQCKEEMKRKTSEELSDIHFDPVLVAACKNDMDHYCRDLVRGSGRVIRCLLVTLDDPHAQMDDACRGKLEERRQLWAPLLQVGLPSSVNEVINIASESPVATTLLTVVAVVLLVIFALGLLFGRVTKRHQHEVKIK